MADKFLPPLIDFIQEKFSHEGNVFYLYGDESVYGFLKFKYKLGKFFLYEKKSEHWKKKQQTIDIIKPE